MMLMLSLSLKPYVVDRATSLIDRYNIGLRGELLNYLYIGYRYLSEKDKTHLRAIVSIESINIRKKLDMLGIRLHDVEFKWFSIDSATHYVSSSGRIAGVLDDAIEKGLTVRFSKGEVVDFSKIPE